MSGIMHNDTAEHINSNIKDHFHLECYRKTSGADWKSCHNIGPQHSVSLQSPHNAASETLPCPPPNTPTQLILIIPFYID